MEFFIFLIMLQTFVGVKGDELWLSPNVLLCLEFCCSVGVRVGFKWLMLAYWSMRMLACSWSEGVWSGFLVIAAWVFVEQVLEFVIPLSVL